MTGGIDQAKLANAEVDWEAGAPRSIFFDDIYFSGDGAAEARHVFADGNALGERFQTARQFVIGEIGFGTGLNFLVAWDLWRRASKPQGARLEFLSFEKFPLSRDQLARAHQGWPQFSALSEKLIEASPPMIEGAHRAALEPGVALTIVQGDAQIWLARMEGRADAWFLDGFAPAKNPELWTPEIFSEIARLSKAGASAATFTVAGAVRRALQDAGFSIEKRQGFGRKREMLTAQLDAPSSLPRRAPWFANANLQPLASGAAIAVIGGGVAGASLAHEIRRAGMTATIIDPCELAGGASGNPAGLIMPRLDLDDGAHARFHRAAYVHALNVIAALQRDSGEAIFNRCGVLQMAASDEDAARQQRTLAMGLLPDGFIEPRADGLFFPQAGVIDPPRYCALLARGARLIRDQALRIDNAADGVRVVLAGGETLPFDAAIIANGRDALRLVAAKTLPLSGVLGQIDRFPAVPAPAFANVFGPYAAPAPGGGVVVGATYEPIEADSAPQTSARATRENIAAATAALPALGATLEEQDALPRAAVRCQTPDRMPVAGPLPDWNFYSEAYDDLRFGRVRDYPPGKIAPGLFILSGLGSRGLVAAPYAAALMLAEIAGAPIEREIAEALHPARFFIRDLKRAKRIVAR